MVFRKVKELLTEEKGSILPIFAVVITVFFIVGAVAIDYARYVAASEKLLTATESAAVSASLTAKRYVTLEIDPGSQRSCCPNANGGCTPCCKRCKNKKIVTGREDELLDKKGYKRYCCSCGCSGYKILNRWVEYEENGSEAAAIAKKFFNLNKPSEMSDAQITSIEAINNKSDPRYPSVIVESKGSVKTLLINALDSFFPVTNLDTIEAKRCAQGDTFYLDLKGRWTRAPWEGCE